VGLRSILDTVVTVHFIWPDGEGIAIASRRRQISLTLNVHEHTRQTSVEHGELGEVYIHAHLTTIDVSR